MNEATTAGTFRINSYLSSKGSKPAMATDPHHIDPTAYLEELLAQASPRLDAPDAHRLHQPDPFGPG
ncbi:hypothetical protein FRC0043_00340 [Corynebacterium belfantii]|nr:hypothetical protein FRC0043_00340 [Corynebacterium belfantii]